MTHPASSLPADINVTPFLDVLLVLLITLLAAMTAREVMDAQLPLSCKAPCEVNGVPIVLEALADHSYLLNRRPVTAAHLLAALHSVFNGRPEKIIQVAGHLDATYQEVPSAMDMARSAGVTVIAIPPSDSHVAR